MPEDDEDEAIPRARRVTDACSHGTPAGEFCQACALDAADWDDQSDWDFGGEA